jgi:hypothetical protein
VLRGSTSNSPVNGIRGGISQVGVEDTAISSIAPDLRRELIYFQRVVSRQADFFKMMHKLLTWSTIFVRAHRIFWHLEQNLPSFQ